MCTGQAVLVIGVSLVILTVMAVVMARMNASASQRIQRRREAWKASAGVGPSPGDGRFPGDFSDSYNNIGVFGGP